jgi:hypothetical protein
MLHVNILHLKNKKKLSRPPPVIIHESPQSSDWGLFLFIRGSRNFAFRPNPHTSNNAAGFIGKSYFLYPTISLGYSCLSQLIIPLGMEMIMSQSGKSQTDHNRCCWHIADQRFFV